MCFLLYVDIYFVNALLEFILWTKKVICIYYIYTAFTTVSPFTHPFHSARTYPIYYPTGKKASFHCLHLANCHFVFYCTLCFLYRLPTRYDILFICLHIWTMKITTRIAAISWSIYVMWLTHMTTVQHRNIEAIVTRKGAKGKPLDWLSLSGGQLRSGQIRSGNIFICIVLRHSKMAVIDLCVDCLSQEATHTHTMWRSVCVWLPNHLSVPRLFN